MRVTRTVTAALIGLPLALVAPTASPADVGGDGASTITGWTGDSAGTVGVGVDSDGGVTAAFTSVESGATSLWISTRGASGSWGARAARLATGVAGSPDFAESPSGAAVLAWDGPGQDGGSRLFVSTRSGASAAWSSPAPLADDTSAIHQPSVGISDAGVPTVGYLHDDGTATGFFTTTRADGGWGDPVEHSEGAVHQGLVAVSPQGYVTVAWTQDNSVGSRDLDTRRFVPTTGQWEQRRIQNDNSDYVHLVDLVGNGQLASLAYFTRPPANGPYTYLQVIRSFVQNPCTTDCRMRWVHAGLGQYTEDWDPPIGIGLNDAGDTTAVHLGESPDGTYRVVGSTSNGTGWGRSKPLSAPGDIDGIKVTQVGSRTLASWVRHTAEGDTLEVRGMHATFNGDSNTLPEQDTSYLGSVTGPVGLAVAPSGDEAIVWPDAVADPQALQSWVVTATEITSPDDMFNTDNSVDVSWTATGGGAKYDVRTRQARAQQGFGRSSLWKGRTAHTSGVYSAARGRTICFSSRVRDPKGHISMWSPQRCTSTAVDDATMSGGRWKRQRSSSYYGGSRLTTEARGATLSIPDVRAKSVGLLVSRRGGNGRVKVTLGSADLGSFSTSGPYANRFVIPVAHFRSLRTGRLRVTVASSGKPVSIDGLFVGAD